jgi:hypothetical protein
MSGLHHRASARVWRPQHAYYKELFFSSSVLFHFMFSQSVHSVFLTLCLKLAFGSKRFITFQYNYDLDNQSFVVIYFYWNFSSVPHPLQVFASNLSIVGRGGRFGPIFEPFSQLFVPQNTNLNRFNVAPPRRQGATFHIVESGTPRTLYCRAKPCAGVKAVRVSHKWYKICREARQLHYSDF